MLMSLGMFCFALESVIEEVISYVTKIGNERIEFHTPSQPQNISGTIFFKTLGFFAVILVHSACFMDH